MIFLGSSLGSFLVWTLAEEDVRHFNTDFSLLFGGMWSET